MNNPSLYFSNNYVHAREQFIGASELCGARIESHVLPSHRGLLGEELATDVARIGPDDATRLLIVSSGTHGPEGFCGSGCQVSLLHDTDWLERAARSGIAVLMIHAVNPYGFSYLQRTNEDNVDPNRNCLRFDEPLPVNEGYAEIEPLLLPPTWPPSEENELALAKYVRTNRTAFRNALTGGQSSSPDGMFFSGTREIWSNLTLREILRKHATHATDVGWIDVHTGLGPYGHGEKIYAGRNVPDDIARARDWWGADVFCPFAGDSVAMDVRGPVTGLLYEECPTARGTLMGLEFGTLPSEQVRLSLRASAWARRLGHGVSVDTQLAAVRQQVRDAFYCDNDVWKGLILGQARVILLQALLGLARS